jgi:hypothetical protein
MRSYPRPTEKYISVNKTDAKVVCPMCGSHDVKRYAVISEGGWWNVTKCQICLHSLDRSRSERRLGPITTISELL